MSHEKLYEIVDNELKIVEDELRISMDSDLAVINNASLHLIEAGGKRMRPAFALMAARFFRDDINEVIPLATGLELTHLATLVHDDVIDKSDQRRGAHTVRYEWGNRISINAGNYIFARALALIASYNRRDLLDVLADASMKICEGEIIQMVSAFDVSVGLKNYLRRIERKTALLISLSCELGAMVCDAHQEMTAALKRYGYYLGMAFQVTDDILDYIADEKVLGKPTGSDIRQGVITLPALYALKYDNNKKELARLLSSPQECNENADKILEIIIDSDGIDYSYYVTEHFASRALKQLECLPESPPRKTFTRIAEYILDREY